MESPQNFPVYDTHLNGYFNWTWTFKLDSDLRWGYFTVYNLAGQIVGPKKEMHWQEMDPIDDETEARLSSKSVAAAWFASNCNTISEREAFAKALKRKLQRRGLLLHVYGACGHRRHRHGVCSRGNPECDKVLEKKYYFYLAFENSLSEDYVTEKVLTALNHYTVPVVFGGANYSRFLPPGSYLDARELGAKRLAARMAAIIHEHKRGNGSMYHDFFRMLLVLPCTRRTSDATRLRMMIIIRSIRTLPLYGSSRPRHCATSGGGSGNHNHRWEQKVRSLCLAPTYSCSRQSRNVVAEPLGEESTVFSQFVCQLPAALSTPRSPPLERPLSFQVFRWLFFRWRNHYTFKATAQEEDVCNICKLLNDQAAMTKTTVYGDFREWWMVKSLSETVISRIR
ncbi:uncharacterized protein LOC134749106 [Cydia strobilella]|uniref:uncharacterized protein LOC134749106 n=1 Tax=Cydia strobilella TaxID=1100964 RepID=UPI003007E80B